MTRAGIVGICGWAGARHYAAYRELGIPVTHFVDVATDAGPVAERLGIKQLHSVEELAAAPVDVISVALPPALQPDVCRKLLAAGKAVLCEKPMAATGTDAQALESVAEGTKLMPAFLLRFHPVYQRMKALIDHGDFGRLQEVAIDSRALKMDVGGWRRDLASGGAMLVNGIHAVDLAHWFCGPQLRVDSSRGERRFFDAPVDDCVRAWLSTDTGTQVSLRAQWWPFCENDVDSEWQDGWILRVRVELDDAVLIQSFNGLRILERGGHGRFELMKAPNLFVEEIRHFVDALENNVTPAIRASDNTRAQLTVDTILEMSQ
jgi:myo-inositol 2-dehydrogenase/D-chiro-inositol 1-dehydrogenase